MNKPLISVLIPAYNHERYVQETILSIINQTYENIELLIINDGSSDSTYDKICDMEILCRKRFEHFYFKTQRNKGTCETLNSLINMSHGEFIFIIASDDIAAPHAIETEFNFIINNSDYVLCVGANDIIDENSFRCFWDHNRKNVYDMLSAEYFSFSDYLKKFAPDVDFLSEEFGTYYNLLISHNHIPNGYLIRKSIFEKTGLCIKEAPMEDYWMLLQISKYGKMKYINNTLFYYRWHGKNQILNSGIKFWETLLYECKKIPIFKNLEEMEGLPEEKMKNMRKKGKELKKYIETIKV